MTPVSAFGRYRLPAESAPICVSSKFWLPIEHSGGWSALLEGLNPKTMPSVDPFACVTKTPGRAAAATRSEAGCAIAVDDSGSPDVPDDWAQPAASAATPKRAMRFMLRYYAP